MHLAYRSPNSRQPVRKWCFSSKWQESLSFPRSFPFTIPGNWVFSSWAFRRFSSTDCITYPGFKIPGIARSRSRFDFQKSIRERQTHTRTHVLQMVTCRYSSVREGLVKEQRNDPSAKCRELPHGSVQQADFRRGNALREDGEDEELALRLLSKRPIFRIRSLHVLRRRPAPGRRNYFHRFLQVRFLSFTSAEVGRAVTDPVFAGSSRPSSWARSWSVKS